MMESQMVLHRTHARVGLLGNPSDGYGGKTISFTLECFYAEVSLDPAEDVSIEPNLQDDGYLHNSLDSLQATVNDAGYLGGLQLLLATCAAFQRHCRLMGISLEQKGFRLRYRSNIPRQCGLSGSSAIVLACLKCLIEHYNVSERLPRAKLPAIALQAEQDLGIVAGPQDRVIQAHEGLMYMDFDPRYIESHGVPRCVPLDPELLPQLYLIYCGVPSSSGKMHSAVRKRYDQGNQEVKGILADVADLAEQGLVALKSGDESQLGSLMEQNFEYRRQLFGDSKLGPANLRMVELARSHGGSAKLCGSGGAIVVIFAKQGADEQCTTVSQLSEELGKEGFTIVPAYCIAS